jgi:hypothetical protein
MYVHTYLHSRGIYIHVHIDSPLHIPRLASRILQGSYFISYLLMIYLLYYYYYSSSYYFYFSLVFLPRNGMLQKFDKLAGMNIHIRKSKRRIHGGGGGGGGVHMYV